MFEDASFEPARVRRQEVLASYHDDPLSVIFAHLKNGLGVFDEHLLVTYRPLLIEVRVESNQLMKSVHPVPIYM